MPDVACVYSLATPAGTITFNDGSADQMYINEIPSGLAGAPISAPIDPVAFGDGSLSYNWWRRGRHILIEGTFLVTSTLTMNSILVIRNDMEEDLRAALESIQPTTGDTATFVWTPLGQPTRTLEVRNDVALEAVHDQGYLVRNFSFGLFSDSADWFESS